MAAEEDVETIGEQLYSRIYPKHEEYAGKLTGEETCSAFCLFCDINHVFLGKKEKCSGGRNSQILYLSKSTNTAM